MLAPRGIFIGVVDLPFQLTIPTASMQAGICHPGHMPRSLSSSSSKEHNLFSRSRAKESKIGYAGHLNGPVIAIILWKIYTRGCYSCAIVALSPRRGRKAEALLRIVRGDRDLRQAVEWRRWVKAEEADAARCGTRWLIGIAHSVADFGITRWTGRGTSARQV